MRSIPGVFPCTHASAVPMISSFRDATMLWLAAAAAAICNSACIDQSSSICIVLEDGRGRVAGSHMRGRGRKQWRDQPPWQVCAGRARAPADRLTARNRATLLRSPAGPGLPQDLSRSWRRAVDQSMRFDFLCMHRSSLKQWRYCASYRWRAAPALTSSKRLNQWLQIKSTSKFLPCNVHSKDLLCRKISKQIQSGVKVNLAESSYGSKSP